jgi:hypothetical protein
MSTMSSWGAASRAEQIVHNCQLQQFPDIGLIFNAGHFSDGLVQSLGLDLNEIGPLNAAHTSRGRRFEGGDADRDRLGEGKCTVEIERRGFEI